MSKIESSVELAKVNSKFYIPVGYPLGYVIGNNEWRYMLEIIIEGKLKFITLTSEEFRLWAHISRCEMIAPRDIEFVLTLKEKGVLLEADTLNELLKKILPLNPIRNGVGYVNEGKNCIALGKEIIDTTGIQLFIWRVSTGICELNTVLNEQFKLQNEPIETFEEEFILAIIELMKHDVLSLR